LTLLVERNDSLPGGELSGATFRDAVLRKLSGCAWPAVMTAPLLKALREAPLTPAQLGPLVDASLEHIGQAELQELPALAYQLLLLSTRGCASVSY
jgi:hypothetical protein